MSCIPKALCDFACVRMLSTPTQRTLPARSHVRHLNAADFDAFADDVFGRIASRYGVLCDLFSFGLHRYWKRRVAALIAEQPWQTLLDSASGTGDIVLRVLRHVSSGDTRRIIVSDISTPMLAIAKRRIAPEHPRVEWCQLDAQSMPSIANESVDLYSISFALKICDREAVLREALRVHKPNGRLMVLEASNIPFRFLHRAYLIYMAICVPVMGWLVTGGDSSAYRYLLHGIRDFPSAEALAEEMCQIGFTDVSFERWTLGIAGVQIGRKPSRPIA